jgi:hypothetical protein
MGTTNKTTRKWMLRQNKEMREVGAFNWTLPALGVRLQDGRVVKTCPQAGACARFCYARNGTFLFPTSKAAHAANLVHVLDDLDGWRDAMTRELQHKRYRGEKYVRIHDSGDFFSDEYLMAWLDIARSVEDVIFYCYTKEVSRFKRIVATNTPPNNFRWLYSMGGLEDHLIDVDNDRHAEVFPSIEALESAGYFNQAESDILAITAPTNRIGILANNIPAFRKKQGQMTFGQHQQQRQTPA